MRNKEIRNMLIIVGIISIAGAIAVGFFNLICSAILLAATIAIISVFVLYTKKRYKDIERLNDYLSLVCSGDYTLDIDDNAEGELSILKNNLYKVVVALQTSNDELSNEKIYLADSLADISHQLKTPLTSIMVMTDLLKREGNEEKRAEFVDIIETQLDKMKWLIQTLLKLSKLDAGTAEFNRAPVEIESIVEESLQPFLLTLDVKDISVKKDIEAYTINGDRNWTIEAVQNIIKNCIEHTAQTGTLTISTSSTNVYNELVISDNGCGIAKEDLPHIFERFYHGKNSSSDSVGIGLALSKEIFSKEKASVDVTSVEGEGTSFSIRFYKTIV